MNEPIEQMHVRTVANGVLVEVGGAYWREPGVTRSPSSTYVFSDMQGFADWVVKQAYRLAGDERK
jgi:hypothetical protein